MKKLYETPINIYGHPMSPEEEKSEAHNGESTRHAAERELGWRRAGFNKTANNQMVLYNPSSTLYQSGILHADPVRANLHAYMAPNEEQVQRSSQRLINMILGPSIDPFISTFMNRSVEKEGQRGPVEFLRLMDQQIQDPTHHATAGGWPLSRFIGSVEGMDANHPDVGPGDKKFLKRNMDAAEHAKKIKYEKSHWGKQSKAIYAALPSTLRREARKAGKAARTPADKRKYLDKFLIPRLEKLGEIDPAIRRQISKAVLKASGETEWKDWPGHKSTAPSVNRKKTRYRQLETDLYYNDGTSSKSLIRNRKTRRSQYSDMAETLTRLQEENTVYMRDGKLYRRPKGG